MEFKTFWQSGDDLVRENSAQAFFFASKRNDKEDEPLSSKEVKFSRVKFSLSKGIDDRCSHSP